MTSERFANGELRDRLPTTFQPQNPKLRDRSFMGDRVNQHSLSVVEAGAWSRPLPVPHCLDKVMCVLNRIMV
ncbi:MAG: hypothetical protein HY785_13860 [Oscillatoriophycideae cyanobacterium NC_groundwater_1537_Pr4_S-0.65um_50_18]|nr:hypothetical protein [Oscillatoriophycideae cyanobacterium NC_groundwater_1537_Pr4_S-0.65um_50_18]